MGDNCRIMIIDDEFIMRQGIRYMMDWGKEGYEVVGEASNGKEALDLLEEINPHVILCDIAMPVMDGLDFIKIVNRKYPDIQVLVLSSYDKFDYVRQALLNGAVDYVLKPTLNPEELLKIVTKAAQKVPGLQLTRKEFSGLDIQLERYLTGYESQLNIGEFHNIFQGSCYRLLVIPLRCKDERGMDLSPILYEKIEGFLKRQEYSGYLKFIINQETLCMALNYGLKDEQRIFEFLDLLVKQLSLIAERIFGILGPRRSKLAELKTDFQVSGFMEEEIFYHKGIHLYFQEELKEKAVCEKLDFRRFSGKLGERKYEEAIDIFYKYMLLAVECRMPEFKLKNQTKNLLYNIISSSDTHVQELENFRKEYFEKVDKAPYCEEYLDTLEEIPEKLRGILIEKEEQDFYLREILEYIQIHYKEELDLQSLAETFNFNYSYMSAYFNSHMGEGFSEYLNRVRIQKSCEYLDQREHSIAQISSMVGYSDHSYFCRVFKKITKRTPSVYRREQWQER